MLFKNLLTTKQQFKNTAITIGKFGVLHRGHLAIINNLKNQSALHGLTPVVFSFQPSPILFFSNNLQSHGKVYSNYIIYKLLQQELGEGFIYFLQKFNLQFASLSAEEFIIKLKQIFDFKILIVGEGFTFGNCKSGNENLLKSLSVKHNFTLILQKLEREDDIVSTTKARQFLANGNIADFNKICHYKYILSGKVIHGAKLAGKVLGFKTANIRLKNLSLPLFGVYAVRIIVNNKEYKGVCNIGVKPTIFNAESPLLEVHIFNFNQNLYGVRICIICERFIRKEQKFANITELKNQIEKDAITANAIF